MLGLSFPQGQSKLMTVLSGCPLGGVWLESEKFRQKGACGFYLNISVTAVATAVNQVRPLILPVKADLAKIQQFPSV